MAVVKPNALSWLGLSAVVLVLDQLSKLWVLRSLPEFQAIPVIDGFWNWYRTYNTGAAFSFLSDAGGWQQFLFTGLAAVICSLLGWWLWRTPRGDWRTALPFSLVIGGAIGNVIDRLQHGHVVDFIQWHWRATSRWTLVTSGQVASNTLSPRRSASARTACETPWALKITVAPSGTSSSSSTNTAPRCLSSSTT